MQNITEKHIIKGVYQLLGVTPKLLFKRKNKLFQPAHGMRSTRLLVEIHNTCALIKYDLNLGQSRMAVFEDCQAAALTTQPTWLDNKIFCCD